MIVGVDVHLAVIIENADLTDVEAAVDHVISMNTVVVDVATQIATHVHQTAVEKNVDLMDVEVVVDHVAVDNFVRIIIASRHHVQMQ